MACRVGRILFDQRRVLFDRLLKVADRHVVDAPGAVPLAVAHAVDPRQRLFEILLRVLGPAHVSAQSSQSRVGAAEVGIQLNRFQVAVYGFLGLAGILQLLRLGIGVRGFERRGGIGLGRGELVRFGGCVPQSLANRSRQLADCHQHLVLVLRLDPLGTNLLARGRIDRSHGYDVAAPLPADRAGDHDADPFAHRHQARQRLIQPAGAGLQLGRDPEGLLAPDGRGYEPGPFHREREHRLQSAVKHRFAGIVAEIRDQHLDDFVLCRRLGEGPFPKEKQTGEGEHQHGQRRRRPLPVARRGAGLASGNDRAGAPPDRARRSTRGVEVVQDLCGGLIAPGRIFFQAAHDDARQVVGHLRVEQLRTSGRLLGALVHHLEHGIIGEGHFTGDHLVHHQTERIEIAAVVELRPLHLLGRHVTRRSHQLARVRQSGRRRFQRLRQAEVGDVRVAVLVEQHVLRLQVAMEDAFRMGRFQRLA